MLKQPSEFSQISRHHASPKAYIDKELALGGIDFLVKCFQSGGGGNAVQRHFQERSHTAGGRGHGRSFESFPFCATRFVDVDVSVHDARHHDRVLKIDPLNRCEALGTNHVYDDPVANHDCRRANTLGKNNALATNKTLGAAHN